MADVNVQKLSHEQRPLNINRAKGQTEPLDSGELTNGGASFRSNYMCQSDSVDEVSRVVAHTGRQVKVIEGRQRGPKPARPMIDWQYKITNQRGFPKGKPLEKLMRHNLNAQWQTVQQNGASARLIIANKM